MRKGTLKSAIFGVVLTIFAQSLGYDFDQFSFWAIIFFGAIVLNGLFNNSTKKKGKKDE